MGAIVINAKGCLQFNLENLKKEVIRSANQGLQSEVCSTKWSLHQWMIEISVGLFGKSSYEPAQEAEFHTLEVETHGR
jgi:hypothetical protein